MSFPIPTQCSAQTLRQTLALVCSISAVLLLEPASLPAKAQSANPESANPELAQPANTTPTPGSQNAEPPTAEPSKSDSPTPVAVPANTRRRSSRQDRNAPPPPAVGACSGTVMVNIEKDPDKPQVLVPVSVVSNRTICQASPTLPSFWWARAKEKSQLGGNLFIAWQAYSNPDPTQTGETPRVDLFVNHQLWSLLDYLERYEMVNIFGSAARQYGYNAFVFSQRRVSLASYVCNFEAVAAASPTPSETASSSQKPPTCRITIDSSERFRGGSTSPLGGF